MDLLLFLNLLSLVTSTSNVNCGQLLDNTYDDQVNHIQEKSDTSSIDEDELLSYYNSVTSNQDEIDISYPIEQNSLLNHLNNTYGSNYDWIKDSANCGSTADVTNQIPLELGSFEFYDDYEIERALVAANVSNITSYGGCGPIAAIGVLDYLARFLGFSNISRNLDDQMERILLASGVFSRTNYNNIVNNVNNNSYDETFVYPWFIAGAVNDFVRDIGYHGIITASNLYSNIQGWALSMVKQDDESRLFMHWNQIISSISNGMPVTLVTGFDAGNGEFAAHCVNIYAYETWVGIADNGDRITKQFIKARLNHGHKYNEYYCDADILKYKLSTLVLYKINYPHESCFDASDFAEEFVNQNGNGQYFFNEIQQDVTFESGETISTSRLRTSYIENKYLVMSPDRKNAGTAFLQMRFLHQINKLQFTASMWSSLEGIFSESFKIQYEDTYDSSFHTFKTIDLRRMSCDKEKPNTYIFTFPGNVYCIRFFAETTSVGGNRNKGRICLDNFIASYL